MSIWWIVQTGYRQKFSWFTSHPIRCLTTTTPLLLSSLSLLRIYRQSYHGLLTLFAQMTIAAAILQTTLLSYCGKRLDVAYIFWISWRKKRKPWKIVLCISLHVHACSTSLSAEIPFLGEYTCFCFKSTYVNYSSEFWKDSCRIFPKDVINAKQSLEYWKLHITFSCIFPFLKVRLVQRYFKRGPNAQNKVRLLKDINTKKSLQAVQVGRI